MLGFSRPSATGMSSQYDCASGLSPAHSKLRTRHRSAEAEPLAPHRSAAAPGRCTGRDCEAVSEVVQLRLCLWQPEIEVGRGRACRTASGVAELDHRQIRRHLRSCWCCTMRAWALGLGTRGLGQQRRRGGRLGADRLPLPIRTEAVGSWQLTNTQPAIAPSSSPKGPFVRALTPAGAAASVVGGALSCF